MYTHCSDCGNVSPELCKECKESLYDIMDIGMLPEVKELERIDIRSGEDVYVGEFIYD
jgi:hypothetical protein